MGGGGSRTETTTQTSAPWKAQQPYLTQGFERASRWVLDDPREFYPFSTVVPFAPETRAAMGRYSAFGKRPPDELYGSAGDFVNAALTGENDAIFSSFRPQIDSAFAMGGRFGGTARAEALGRGFANAALPYAQLAPQLAGAREAAQLGRIGVTAQVGAQDEAMAARRLGERMQRFDFAQNERQRRLEDYMRLITGNYGSQTINVGPGGQGGSPLLTGLGGAGTGAAIGANFGPWGAGIGAGLGGLTGLVGGK